MIGKNKMKDWKSAIRTWEKNNSNTIGGSTDGNNRNSHPGFIPDSETKFKNALDEFDDDGNRIG
jgi:hypothetical protein